MTKTELNAAVPARLAQIETALAPLDDEQAVAMTTLFPAWAAGVAYTVDYRAQYDGLLYRCVQAHMSQPGWEPPNVPALWTRVSTEEWPEWVQPTGAQDAYQTGDKVSHNGKHWVSTYDDNVWEPGIFGWNEVTA